MGCGAGETPAPRKPSFQYEFDEIFLPNGFVMRNPRWVRTYFCPASNREVSVMTDQSMSPMPRACAARHLSRTTLA
jgi:hypothetical protein